MDGSHAKCTGASFCLQQKLKSICFR